MYTLASGSVRVFIFGQIVTNVFVQIVVLLYLIDNNDNTSWMILMGSGVGVLIEAWKVCCYFFFSADDIAHALAIRSPRPSTSQ